ncbi:MAG: lytic transglycosylase domain-containing protein, partial [Myxococcota bacterium]
MPSLLLSLALALGAPAAASKLNDDPSVPPVESSQTLPVDDPAPAEPAAVPLEDREATHAPQEGIWAWVVRLEGEILTPEMKRAIVERAREKRDQDAAGADGPADKADGSSKVASAKPAKTGPVVLSELDPDDYDIPLATNAHVRRWVNYFTGKGRPHFQRYLDRSAIYRPMMEAKLEAAGQPKDLVYLAMIESGFNAHALSHAGAGGLWQFMPATGRMYKLRVDWWVDDRRDPVKSTDAAVAHLGDLHKMFKGNWYLAWGAYNAGPGRIRGAMRRAGTSDFWKLVKGGHLPSETANYAPKLIAAAIVAKNAEQYGFIIKPATPY